MTIRPARTSFQDKQLCKRYQRAASPSPPGYARTDLAVESGAPETGLAALQTHHHAEYNVQLIVFGSRDSVSRSC